MKLLTDITNYEETIKLSLNLTGEYNKQVIFHCYWNGMLNEKHLYSIMSCYYFNVHNNKHKIILWLDNNTSNEYNIEIKKYAEIRHFSYISEMNEARIFHFDNLYFPSLAFYSDLIRNVLLYNYGGIWFDLDCLFLRNFDPIFCNFENEICLYQWETQNYPNNAIYMSLEAKSEKMKKNIEYILNLNKGFGFQQANLTYDTPLDILVLPCSWFDPNWISNPFNINSIFEHTNKDYNFDNFFKGSFCFHWHNRWDHQIQEKSIIMQLIKIIKDRLLLQ